MDSTLFMLRNLRPHLLIALCIALFSQKALASDEGPSTPKKKERPISVGLGFGAVEGILLEGTIKFSPTVRFRFQHAGGLEYNKYERYDRYDYRYRTDGNLTSLILDVHPLQNGFFLSAGYVQNSFNLRGSSTIPEGEAKETNTVSLLGLPLFATQVENTDDINLVAKVRWREEGPRLATGWLFDVNKHLSFRMEVGALFFGEPDLSLVTTGEIGGVDINDIEGFEGELQAQEDNFKDGAKDFDMLPIMNFGLNYNF